MPSPQACQGSEGLQSEILTDLSEHASVKEQMEHPRAYPDVVQGTARHLWNSSKTDQSSVILASNHLSISDHQSKLNFNAVYVILYLKSFVSGQKHH